MVERLDSLWETTDNFRIKDRGKVAKGRTTHVFEVTARRRGNTVGHVKWLPKWRQYVFCPLSGTVYDPADLDQLAYYVRRKTQEHREKSLTAKSSL